jgi:hypothetical protein
MQNLTLVRTVRPQQYNDLTGLLKAQLSIPVDGLFFSEKHEQD